MRMIIDFSASLDDTRESAGVQRMTGTNAVIASCGTTSANDPEFPRARSVSPRVASDKTQGSVVLTPAAAQVTTTREPRVTLPLGREKRAIDGGSGGEITADGIGADATRGTGFIRAKSEENRPLSPEDPIPL